MAFSDVITLTHLNLGYRVLEAPIGVQERRSGKSTINTMTAVDTLIEIVNVLMWFKPLKFFVPLAVVVGMAGVLWAIPFLVMGRGLSSISLLLLLAAMMIGIVGLPAARNGSRRRAGIHRGGGAPRPYVSPLSDPPDAQPVTVSPPDDRKRARATGALRARLSSDRRG